MKIHAFKGLFPNLDMIASPDSFFGSLKMEFPHYLRNGFFTRTSKPSIWIYTIEQDNEMRIGLIASTSVQDIFDNNILKHEHTLAEKEQQMLHLALQRSAMIKPVLLAHDMTKKLLATYQSVIEKQEPYLVIPFEKEKSIHRLYRVENKKIIDTIVNEFKKIEQVYIADGHHRVSTGILLNKNKEKNSSMGFGDLLSIYFAFNQLTIYDYNRTVSILKELSPTLLMAKLSKYFKIKIIKHARKPKHKHQICFLINQESYMLTWKSKYLNSKQTVILDAELLDRYVFTEIMGIEDVRNDSRLSYIAGVEQVKGVENQLLKDDYAVGFLLYPVSKSELKAVADAGLTLPPKSTWFEPRIKNGIISQEFK